MSRQSKPKLDKPFKRKSCLLCRIRKLKCVSDTEHLHLNNGEINPCGNCMIYKAKCEPFTGSADRSLIKYLNPAEYNDLVNEREKLLKSEKALQNKNLIQESTVSTPDKKYDVFVDDRPNLSFDKDISAFKNVKSFEDNGLTRTSKENISSYLNDSISILNEDDFYTELDNINLLKSKMNELRHILELQRASDSSIKKIVESLEEEISNKEQNLKTLRMNESYSKDFVNWNIGKLRETIDIETYDRSDSMHTNVPIDKFDILKSTKKTHKRKIQEVNGIVDDDENKDMNNSVENQLMKFSGFKEISLDPVLAFDLNPTTGEVIPNARESYWNNHDTSLKFLPIIFGKYNTDAFISKPGFETIMREIIGRNPNFEIVSERDLKATLFLVLKFIQYHLSCGNMEIDMYTDPFEYFGNDLFDELTTVSKTSDKVLLLYSKLPISLINETLKKYPKFKETHRNLNKMVNESSYASTLFQYFVVLTSVHQENFRPHILNYLAEPENTQKDSLFADSLEYFEVEDILLINSIHFSEKSKFCSVESLDFIESMLVKFEQQFTFSTKNVFYEILSSFVRCVLEIGLDKFENYLDLDEASAEKRRKLFWKAVYWDVKIQTGFGSAPLINIDHVTCLLPKFFIHSGVVSISDLKWFLLNKGFTILTDPGLSIDDKLEILNVSCSIITSDFMNSVLFSSDYASLTSLLKMDPSINNDRLRRLLNKVEYYNKFNTMFKMIIGNVHKLLMASENNTCNTEYAKFVQLKYLMNASSMRSYMLTSSLSIISRLGKTCTDASLSRSSKEAIDLFGELALNNEVTTLNISILSGKSILSLRSIDVIKRSYSNIIFIAASYSKNITTDLFLCTIRVHQLLRLCSQILIKKDIYNGKNRIHRVHSFVNLFSHRIRLCSRIVAQLFMAQQGMKFENLKEFVYALPEFFTDREDLKNELDFIFDTSLFEHDSIADMELSRNKKRYDDIVKKFKKMGSDITRAASSKDLNAKPRSKNNIKLPKLSALTNSIKSENPGIIGFNTNFSTIGSPLPIPKIGTPSSEVFMKNMELSRNTSPNNYPSPSQMLHAFGKIDQQQKAPSQPPQKFSQSNERLQHNVNKTSGNPPNSVISDSSNSIISTINATTSSNGLSYKGENMGNGRNMVERIDVGTMEEFLINKDVDNLFSTFWDGFNMD
ncbi:hypothetical protein FOG48_01035 [Hanseniaspora uvarum]|nr:hypothetical protein FOG48_01035 [Hanseniaspora uvarum]